MIVHGTASLFAEEISRLNPSLQPLGLRPKFFG
ncbi:hypothetical protein AMST5_00841 [freshwater sediment metagenome]|uniref:Uncharacterized protein n=1 Tax=freshwater sediment metagenome TaxID=556182 RepID=A0AA48LZ05_9ZZZZ